MTKPGNPQHCFLDHVVQLYGDLIFDLCQSLLWNATDAQVTFRTILKDLRRKHAKNDYQEFERAWILRIVCEHIRKAAHRHGRSLTSSERVLLDANLDIGERLQHFDSYFHRLSIDDRLVLLLRDKFGFPYNEIASILGIPEGSLKIRRQQALGAVEEWIWSPSL